MFISKIAIIVSALFAIIAINNLIAAASPNFVSKNTVKNSNGFTLQTGIPYLGQTDEVSWAIGSMSNQVSGNTTICTFDLDINGSCVEEILELVGTNYQVEEYLKANDLDSFLITVRNMDTLTTTSYRWNPRFGIEWHNHRGNLTATRGTQIVDPANNVDFQIMASPDGLNDIIIGESTSSNKRTKFAVLNIPIPAHNVHPNTAYARDLTFLASEGKTRFVAAISLGKVYAFPWQTGSASMIVEKPCGFQSEDFHGRPVNVYGNFQYLVWGNDNISGKFVVCSLASNSSLTELWSATYTGPITPVNGDYSVEVLSTQHQTGLYPQRVNYLYVSGFKGTDNSKNFLFAFDIQDKKAFAWEKQRQVEEQYNMPVVVSATYDHVAVSINGILVGLDPVDQSNPWSCSTQQLGCTNTPAIVSSYKAHPVGRVQCTASGQAKQTIIAFDINTANTNQCQLQWSENNAQSMDIKAQNRPSATVGYGVFPYDSFALWLAETGSLWAFSFRSTSDPAPTMAPTMAPTPAPTLPGPNIIPGPKKIKYTPPLYAFDSILLREPAQIDTFSADGPIVSAVAFVKDRSLDAEQQKEVSPEDAEYYRTHPNFKKQTSHNSAMSTLENVFDINTMQERAPTAAELHELQDEIDVDGSNLGNYANALYYESVPIGTLNTLSYGLVEVPAILALFAPQVVFNGGGQYVVNTYTTFELGGENEGYLVYTNPKSPAGVIDRYGRYGAIGQVATDNAGTLVYSTGLIAGAEHIIAKIQKGDGAKSRDEVYKIFKPPANMKFDNYSSHIGNIVYAQAGMNQMYVFSYLNTLHFVNPTAAVNQNSIANYTNPCGFEPSASKLQVYYPMQVAWLQSSTINIVVAAIDTWDQHGKNTAGICTYHISTGKPMAGTPTGPIENVTSIQNIQPVGNTDQIALDIYNNKYNGELVVIDLTLGVVNWRVLRENAFGSTILPVKNTEYIITNMDVDKNSPTPAYNTDMLLSLVDGKSGKILGQCDFALQYYQLVPVKGDNVKSFLVVGNIWGGYADTFERYVRAVDFVQNTAGGYDCKVVWQTDVGSSVHGVSSVNIEVNEQQYVVVVTDDGHIYSVTPEAGALPTPAPPLTPADVPNFAHVQNLSSYWKTPFSQRPTFSPILFNDFQTVGNPAFATVDAGYTGKAEDEEGKDTDDVKRYTALIAFDAAADLNPSQYPQEEHFMLPRFTNVAPPVSLFNNFGFTGEKPPPKSAVAWATYETDPFLYVIAFPGSKNRFAFPRLGGLSKVASDGNGRLFYSAGAYDGGEKFYALQLSADGQSLTELWNVSVISRYQQDIANFTSGMGDAVWIFEHSSPGGYVGFSFEHTFYIRNANTGYHVGAVENPCGWVPPNDAGNYNYPAPMIPIFAELMNHTSILMLLVPNGPGVDSGEWGVCGLSSDGSAIRWRLQLPPSVDRFVNELPIFFADYAIISAVSYARGGGILIGIDMRTGASWLAMRKNAVNSLPAPLPLTNNNDQYFVANMDSIAPDEPHSEYLSVVQFADGQVVAQCPFACAINPIRTFVQDSASGEYIHYFVCTLKDYPTTFRAVKFVPNDNTNNRFDCQTYYDYELPMAATGVFLVDHTYISVALANGGTVTMSMIGKAHHHSINPPSGKAPGPGGLSGGAVAALVICMLILTGVIGFAVYYYKFRAVKRSAISEATTGLEYGSSSSGGGIQAGESTGYGSTQAGDV